MKMELIQPFINAADAVLAQGLQCTTAIGNLSMEEEAYRRKGVAAHGVITGDIEGRIIIDLDPETAVRVASQMAGRAVPSPTGWFARPSVNSPIRSSEMRSRFSMIRDSTSRSSRRKFT